MGTRSPAQTEYHVRLKSLLKSAWVVADLEIQVPLPAHAESPLINVSGGIARHDAENHAITWHVKRLEGHRDLALTVAFGSPPQQRISLASAGPEVPTIGVRY